jgi:hypothetical protein
MYRDRDPAISTVMIVTVTVTDVLDFKFSFFKAVCVSVGRKKFEAS